MITKKPNLEKPDPKLRKGPITQRMAIPYPLNEKDRESFRFIYSVSGTGTLAAGTVTLKDTHIRGTSVCVATFKSVSGTAGVLSAAVTDGQIVITSIAGTGYTVTADSSTFYFVVII